MKKLLLSLMIILLPLAVSAYDFKVNNIGYNILSQEDQTVEVTYTGKSIWDNEYNGEITIPEIVIQNNVSYRVIAIGEYAFYGGNITSISLPDKIETLKKCAFYGNSSLTDIKLPANLISIEESAFDRTGLTSLSLPPSIKYIASAFYMTNISKIFINNLETWLGIEYYNTPANGAFYGRYDLYVNNEILQNVTIPEGVSELKSFAFCCCKSIISVNLPNTVEKIGRNAFYGCGGLGYVNLPNNLKSIGAYAFCGNSGLSFSSIPESVSEIGEYAFQGTYITSIVWPSKVETIPEECFACCPLTNITIPNTVKTIGVSAFLGCDFSEINLPESIETIEGYAFDFCENLKSIEIPSSVKTIGSHVFTRCHGLVSIKLNEGLELIGDNAFNECGKLVEINIPSTISEIQDNTFNGCFRLPSIILPNSIKKIGMSAFKGCSGMTQITSLAIEPPFIYGNSFEKYDIPVYVPKGKKELYQQANGWKQFTNIIELVNKYKLSYFIDEELFKEIEIAEGATITPEAAPTKEGYTFSGWSEIPETMPAHDVTVTGTFSINEYKLTYTVDGEEYKSSEVEYGATITAEEAPTKEGYTFSGWSEIPETMPANDVTVTGSFTINSYKLTYMIDNKVYKEIMYEYGATITPELQPEGDYATFEWTGLPQTMPAHDVVVYGSYTSEIIETLMKTQPNIRIYSPNGKNLEKLQKGLNIVVLDDGTVKKVVVK